MVVRVVLSKTGDNFGKEVVFLSQESYRENT
jgi:hypothetical protein